MARSELAQRVLVAAIGIPLAIVLIHAGGWALGGVLALVAAAAARELFALAAPRSARAFSGIGMLAAAFFVLMGTAVRTAPLAVDHFWTATIVLALALTGWAIFARGVEGRPLAAVAITLFGAVFTGGTLVYAVFLRHLPDEAAAAWLGASLVAYPIALTWIGDSAAYFAGRAWGRRKLMVTVSPGKTVEGAIAGLVAATITGAAFAALVFARWLGVPIGVVAGAIGGALISIAAQLGDLAESLLKREAGVKDSGALLPGHGGVLDRFDALFFTLPVAYVYLGVILPRLLEGLPWP
jgi:phosphatidate cytidylyltransferase